MKKVYGKSMKFIDYSVRIVTKYLAVTSNKNNILVLQDNKITVIELVLKIFQVITYAQVTVDRERKTLQFII